MLRQDLRHALRSLARNPGFTLVVALTLALGIGANTAMFSILRGVLLAPLPYPDAERIVALSTYSKPEGRLTPRLAGGDLVDIRADGQAFEALSCYFGGELGVQLRNRAEFTGVYFVNPEFFRILGATPAYGTLPGNADTDRAVVSRAFAERNFGSGASALGQTIHIENKSYRLTAVLPAGFQFPRKADVWAPAPWTPDDLNRTAYNYPVIARLKAGVTLAGGQARLDTIGARLAAAFPGTNRNKSFIATPLREQMVGSVRTTLLFLMGAVGLVLLIACTNVADLMLARTTARSREMAIRAALGARRRHILRPLLAESALLALLGGALGLLLARLGTNLFRNLSAAQIPLPRMNEVRVDLVVLAFTAAISVLASLLFGLAPAWQASRGDLQDALKQGGSRGLVGGRSPALRHALVIAQIALSFVLAVGAGLLLRSFAGLTTVPLGYRTGGILVMYAHAPARSLEEHLGVGRMFESLFAQLEEIPGVTSVAGAMGLPAGQYSSSGAYAVEGKTAFGSGQRLPHAGFRLSSPGYFQSLGIPLRRGRDFSMRDDYGTPLVAIISEALARASFPNRDPIGKRVQCNGLDSSGKWMTVVGVVGDVRQESPASPPAPQLYMPLKQHPYYGNELQVVVRTTLPPASLVEAVRRRARALDPEIATKFTSLDAMLSDSIARPRFRMLLISGFAALALLLAMAGVYGVMSYLITQRTSEFGLRVALGAGSGDVVGLVLGGAARLAVIGLAIGGMLSLAAGRVMAGMLFGIKPTDAVTYAVVLIAMTPVILLAAAVPAWRATRIDPLTALREE